MSNKAALGQVALGALCISFAPILVKWCAGGPTNIALWRMIFATAALALLAPWAAKRWPRAKDAPSARRSLLLAVGAGVLFSLDLFVWHKSIVFAGAGLATLLGNTQVFWVAAFSALLLGETVSRKFVLWAAIALAGVALICVPGSAEGNLRMNGIVFGLLTGVVFGGYILLLRESGRDPGSHSMIVNLGLAAAVSTVLLVPLALASGESLNSGGPENVAKLVALGLGVHVGGWLLISTAMSHLPAARGAVVVLLQPVLATIWGVLFFSETFTTPQMAGMALTLVAVWGASTGNAKKMTADRGAGEDQLI